MRDEQLRELYAHAMHRRRGASRADCVPEDRLLTAAKGEAPAAERRAVLDHVGQCPDCRTEFELLRRASGERPVLHRRAQPLALAASIAALVGASVLVWQWRVGSTDTWRGSDAVSLVAPIAGVATEPPVRLTWRPVPRAVTYTVEVFEAGGASLWSARTPDTTAVLPPSVPLGVDRELLWRVRVERSDGSQLRSSAARFRVQSR